MKPHYESIEEMESHDKVLKKKMQRLHCSNPSAVHICIVTFMSSFNSLDTMQVHIACMHACIYIHTQCYRFCMTCSVSKKCACGLQLCDECMQMW